MIAKGKLNHLRRSGRLPVAILLMGTCAVALAQDKLSQESLEAQRSQAALQQRIDAADEATQQALRELRTVEREADRLQGYNAELAPTIEQRDRTIVQREEALQALSETRETLPVLMRDLVDKLQQMIEADLPFLRDERLARVEALERMLVGGEMSQADKFDRLLAAWRTELDYGRELDAWRGELAGTSDREVEYLRLGRLGLYYITPDNSAGGVWKVETDDWQALNDAQLAEVRKGLRIAREQRAPELLALPVSVSMSHGQMQEGAS